MGIKQHIAFVGDVIDEDCEAVAGAALGRRADGTQPLRFGAGFDAFRRRSRQRRRRFAVDLDIVGLRLAVLHRRHYFDAAEAGLVEAGVLRAVR